MKISIVKEPSILRDGIVNVLQEKFKDYQIEALDSSSISYRELTSNLIIIDLDVNLNILSMINHLMIAGKKVIVWTSSLHHPLLIDLFKHNLDGYFYNGMEKEELFSAIEAILNGKQYVHQTLAPILLNDYIKLNEKTTTKPVGVLSTREWEVLELLTKGYKNDQIGEILFLGERTIKSYVSSILKKLDVPDRTNAVLHALRQKWFYI